MNHIKKIIISVIIGLITLLGLCTTANAYTISGDGTWKVGNSVTSTTWLKEYQESSDIYCVEHGQRLTNQSEKTYDIISQVTIRGCTSTDHTGKSQNGTANDVDLWNAKLAYILSGNNGTGTKGEGQVANAIWNNMSGWMRNVGKNHVGLYENFAGEQKGNIDDNDLTLAKEAWDYACRTREFTGITTFTDQTDKNKIGVYSYKDRENGISYMHIGPFNWSFPGNIVALTVRDQNVNPIEGVRYSSYTGNTEYYISESEIKPGTDFYICVPENKGVNMVTRIEAASSYEEKVATIWFLKSKTDEYQNLIKIDSSTDYANLMEGFNYDIPLKGDLHIIKVDDRTGKKLNGVKLIIRNQDGNYVGYNGNGEIIYTDRAHAYEFETGRDGEGKVNVTGLVVGRYSIYETYNPYYGYLVPNEAIATVNVTAGSNEGAETRATNHQSVGDLHLIKVNEDNKQVKLNGVGFVLQRQGGGYVAYNNNVASPENLKEVSNIDEAYTFITGQNGNDGEILVKGLAIGNYEVREMFNPNYGYEPIPAGGKVIDTVAVVDGQTADTSYQETNKQIYVKLSGYVWVDMADGKRNERNNLYKTSIEQDIQIDNGTTTTETLPDTKDILFNGITVRLKDRTTGETVMETVTSKRDRYQDSMNDGNGEYLFMDVLIDKLEDYYIEFEYDGLTYTNVIPHIDQNTGSKSAESEATREEFNRNFSVVEGETRNTGFTRDANGNRKHDLSYNINETGEMGPEATLINNGQYLITANTDVPNYMIRKHFTYGQEEVRYINLGLYKREQPNIALGKDLHNVRLTINGYEHTYLYAKRFQHKEGYEDGFNVGIQYDNMTYERAIYKADYEYINEKQKDKELKVYITYQLVMKNASNTLITQVNSIVDYYDSRYQIVSVGNSLDDKGNVNADIAHLDEQGNLVGKVTTTTYNDQYNKAIIQNNTVVQSGYTGKKEDSEDTTKLVNQETIYVQFSLGREAVIDILNGKENLKNVAEINSYSVFDGDKIYAGIDTNSNPGNAVPDKKVTHEDDTSVSAGLKLTVAEAREMSGKVFLDETTDKLMTGEVRQGNGMYEENEKGIEGVEITFADNSGSDKVYTATTDHEGNFSISDYIPGDYTLTYTWGDTTYTVQDYKGTIYDSKRDQSDRNWYKKEVETRKTDALDNYNHDQQAPKGSRLQIDAEMLSVDKDTSANITRTKMDSTTPIMGVGIEMSTDGNTKFGITSLETQSDGDKFIQEEFKIKNVDLGIVERPRQDLALTKRVKTMKITLANGQVMSDLTIDENGKVTGEIKGVTYMRPSANIEPNNGFIKAELDNEIIQGAKLEVGYEIKATNQSELDYLSEKFYQYGMKEGNVVTITPTAIIDYLDRDWAFDQEKNQQWEVKELDQIEGLVAETVYNNQESTINEKAILYTEALKEQKLEPTKLAEVMLNVSKLLTTTDDISLDNETEVAKITKTGGSKPQSTPGNYIPGAGATETDDSMAETVIVTPATGEDQNYIIPIIIGLTSLMILGTGVIIIKKKIIK